MGAGATRGPVGPRLLSSPSLTYLTNSTSDAKVCHLGSCKWLEWPLGFKQGTPGLCLGVWGFLARQAKVADGNGAVGQYPVAVPPASSYAAGGQQTGQGGVGGLCPVDPPRPSPSLFSTRGHAEAPVAIEATARSSGAELAGDAETATPLSLHKRGR